ncbi:heat shock protein 70 family [Endogone sp. FLAS-F59071]|nr:heat shock protein 70 family [Endogone sp. FLAS-F59071]|eukprot:RUS21325.1 heat shock protein 70 family [Endogone sp. FLAS-F59071]
MQGIGLIAAVSSLQCTQAQAQIVRDPNHTVARFKNLIGKSFSEAEILSGSAAPVINKDELPAYEIALKDDKTLTFTVKAITTKYLTQLRTSAEAFLGTPITGAVLAIPSYFTDQQREELRSAATDAGITVFQFIHESAAAALAYNTGQQGTINDPQDQTVVIADLGGHSFDVTVLNVRSGMFNILATAHDTELGGATFDELLVNHFAAEFKKKTKIDITNNKKALAKLSASAEITKRTLSSQNQAPCSVESLSDGIDFHGNINRLRFEILSSKVFGRCLDVIQEVLTKADLDANEIDEVLLVGGSSRIPKLSTRLRDIFKSDSTRIRLDIEPDEAVAYGCAIQGSLIQGFDPEDIAASVHPVVTLTPHTSKPIGVVNAKGDFVTVVPRDTPLPVRRAFEFGNSQDSQRSVYLALWEGEHEIIRETLPKREGAEEDEEPETAVHHKTKPATLLAELVLDGLAEGVKAGQAKIEVVVTIDAEEKVTVVLREKRAGGKIVKVEVGGKSA